MYFNYSGIPSTASYAEDDSITVNAPSSEYGPPKNGMCYARLNISSETLKSNFQFFKFKFNNQNLTFFVTYEFQNHIYNQIIKFSFIDGDILYIGNGNNGYSAPSAPSSQYPPRNG